MLRKIIAGAAVAGAVTFGIAGIAGAASAATTPSGTTKATLCAKLPTLQSKVQAREAKINAWIPKAQAREAKAKANNHPKLATAIGNRITRVQDRETKVNARLAKAQAACNTSQNG
jgi:phage shock protein A